jgi:hypothetical protein
VIFGLGRQGHSPLDEPILPLTLAPRDHELTLEQQLLPVFVQVHRHPDRPACRGGGGKGREGLPSEVEEGERVRGGREGQTGRGEGGVGQVRACRARSLSKCQQTRKVQHRERLGKDAPVTPNVNPCAPSSAKPNTSRYFSRLSPPSLAANCCVALSHPRGAKK